MVQLFLAVTLITVINTPKGPGSPSQDSNLDTIATFIQTPLVKAREQEQMAKHGGLVRLALSSDGHYAVTGSENGFVVVSRLSDKTKLRSTRIDEFSDAFFAGVCFDMHDVSFVYYVTLKGLYRWNWRKDELPDRVFGEHS